MTRTITALSGAAMLIACALPITAVSAQDSAAARNARTSFDPSAAVSLTGATIIRVDTLRRGESNSVSALLSSGTDSISAMIGPVAFLMSKSLTLAAGDVIDIAGSKLMMGGQSMLVATEIKKGETTVVLRDKATGVPAWPQTSGAGSGAMRKP